MERKIIPFPLQRRVEDATFQAIGAPAETEWAELTAVIPRAEASPVKRVY